MRGSCLGSDGRRLPSPPRVACTMPGVGLEAARNRRRAGVGGCQSRWRHVWPLGRPRVAAGRQERAPRRRFGILQDCQNGAPLRCPLPDTCRCSAPHAGGFCVAAALRSSHMTFACAPTASAPAQSALYPHSDTSPQWGCGVQGKPARAAAGPPWPGTRWPRGWRGSWRMRG